MLKIDPAVANFVHAGEIQGAGNFILLQPTREKNRLVAFEVVSTSHDPTSTKSADQIIFQNIFSNYGRTLSTGAGIILHVTMNLSRAVCTSNKKHC